MGLLCDCPQSEALESVPVFDCPTDFGQLQKVIFQREKGADGKLNKIETPDGIETKATWTPLLTASDSTKVVVSPYIQNPETEAGGMITYGGGNETLGGQEMNMGTEPSSFSGQILRANPTTIKALKKFACESLAVYLVDENGFIGCLVDDYDSPTEYMPVPVRSFFVGDRVLGGLEEPDMNAISWSFRPNWSDNVKFIKPDDFNPLTDLVE